MLLASMLLASMLLASMLLASLNCSDSDLVLARPHHSFDRLLGHDGRISVF